MKKLIAGALVAGALAGCGWSNTDRALLAGSYALQAVDTAQTIQSQENGGRELNPLIGEHPSKGQMLGIAGGTALAKYVIADRLQGKYRTWFLIGVSAVSATAVSHNHFKSGIRIEF